MAARKRRPFTGLLVKAIHLGDVKPRGLRASFAVAPDKNDFAAHILEELDARYAALDKFFGLQPNIENIWEERANALLAYQFDIPVEALKSGERLTRYMIGRYVPGFSLKGSSEKKHGAPLEWDFKQLAQLFADVEFLKRNTGKSITKICQELPTKTGYAKRWGRYRGKPEGLRRMYAKAKKLRGQDFKFALYLCGPDALIQGTRTDLIQVAIEQHALK
jgi:hypothetical protein